MISSEDITVFRTEDSICSQSEFLDFANSLGKTITLNDGNVIKSLRVTNSCTAKSNTLSQKYGSGIFPFHTDTAFWTKPARLVLLRAVSGDLRRPTVVKSFAALTNGITQDLLRRSSWICDTGLKKYYTTMYFENHGKSGLRYDPNCMQPANKAAKIVDEVIRPRSFEIKGEIIDWKPNRVAIIPNWYYLHARGTGYEDFDRLIERIYIY